MTFVMGGVPHAPGSDRIPVELLQILTQYAICRLPAQTFIENKLDSKIAYVAKVDYKSDLMREEYNRYKVILRTV